MGRLLITIVNLLMLSESNGLGLFFTNNTGVFFKNNSNSIIETVIPYHAGATYVDFIDDKEVFTILGDKDPLSYRIVRVIFPDQTPAKCNIPTWCSDDENCKHFCNVSRFQELSEVLTPKKCRNCSNLAVDWEHRTMYWTCTSDTGDETVCTIHKADVNGSISKVINNFTNVKVLDLKIDPYESKLFWLQIKNDNMTLKSSNLDGREEKYIFQPYSDYDKLSTNVFLDINNKRIYVTDRKSYQSVFMDYNGSDVTYVGPKLLEQFKLMKIGTQSRLFHPRAQAQHIPCSTFYGCKSCQLLTLNGVRCLDREVKSRPIKTVSQNKNIGSIEPDDSLNTPPVINSEGTKPKDSVSTPVDKTIQTSDDHQMSEASTFADASTTSTNKTTDNKEPIGSDNAENIINTSTASVASGSSRVTMFLVLVINLWVARFFLYLS